MTIIRPECVHLVASADLAPAWAADLGRGLAADIDQDELRLLQERVVGLGHGVSLTHVRTDAVVEPTLGAWKASDAVGQDQPWLWLVALIPAADPSRHLGWLAHLAAGLHETDRRDGVFAAADQAGLLRALEAMLAPRQAPVPAVVSSPIVATGTSAHRMIIAILKEVEVVDHLLALFVEHEVRGATVIEARGMAEHLSAHMSLFAGFKSAFKSVGHSQIIMSVVPAVRTAEVLELIKEAAGGLRTPGSGVAFAIDVPATIGFHKVEDG